MSTEAGGEKVRMHIDPTERAWIRVAIVVLVIFALAITVAGFMLGIQVPTEEQRVDPRTIGDAAPWAAPAADEEGDPRIQELVPGEKYAVYIIAKMWLFAPSQVPTPESGIEIPAGAEVTFYVTSTDVQHGFKVQNTNVNFMAVPGEVSTLTTEFDEPGTYDFICTEYCGTGHAAMFGSITITE
ncbi:MAG: cytochrome C oxidase subunit II [Acidimicrobiia bacterium]|nr:cytochrome C oxidase subunit II [Acidimicrobiia bacterium]